MNFVFLIIGIAVGIFITLVLLKSYAPHLLIKEGLSKYDFEETNERITVAVNDNNWKMPHVHDLKAILDKNGYSVKKVKVLEICKPEFANKILSKSKERIASSLMPCRVAVYQTENNQVVVSRMRGKELGFLFGGVVAKVMGQAGDESEKIIETVLF